MEVHLIALFLMVAAVLHCSLDKSGGDALRSFLRTKTLETGLPIAVAATFNPLTKPMNQVKTLPMKESP